MAAGKKNALEIVVDLLVEGFFRHFRDAARGRAADIVDENVDAAKSLAARLRHVAHLRIVEHVADMGHDLAVVADARHRLRHRIRILVDGKNLGALAREQHRRGAAVAPARADTAGAADQRYFARQTSGHVADYPQSSLVASLAPSASACNLAQAICGWMRPPRPQSVPAMTLSRPTTLA